MSFLKSDYKVPQSNQNYFKFQQGENNFRILSSAIVGYVYWTEDKKPVRLKEMWKKKPSDIKTEKNGSYRTNHFWAFVIWNYEINAIQIMEITQKTIMNPIKALVDNKKWGDPKNYDITITKTGDGLETEYSVMPNPQGEVQKEILDEYEAKPVRLEALFVNGDPFAQEVSDEQQNEISQKEREEIEEATSGL